MHIKSKSFITIILLAVQVCSTQVNGTGQKARKLILQVIVDALHNPEPGRYIKT